MPNTPKRPDVSENDKHRAMPVIVDGKVLVVRPEPTTASGTPLNHAEKTLHAMADHIEVLEARKWDVQHTDAMNDMVLLGIDRDSWKGRAEALEARMERQREEIDALHDEARWKEDG